MIRADYKQQFIAHMIKRSGIERQMAQDECEATIEAIEECGCPLDDAEGDAEEAMSYWNE